MQKLTESHLRCHFCCAFVWQVPVHFLYVICVSFGCLATIFRNDDKWHLIRMHCIEIALPCHPVYDCFGAPYRHRFFPLVFSKRKPVRIEVSLVFYVFCLLSASLLCFSSAGYFTERSLHPRFKPYPHSQALDACGVICGPERSSMRWEMPLGPGFAWLLECFVRGMFA